MSESSQIARIILEGFNKHYRIFRETAAAARGYFEKKEWEALRQANFQRIDMYDKRVLEGAAAVIKSFPSTQVDESLWPQVKKEYISLLYEHRQPELAETYFNSLAAKVLHRRYHNNQYIFSRPAVAAEHIEAEQPTYRCYYPREVGLRANLEKIYSDFEIDVPLANPKMCIKNLIHVFRRWKLQMASTTGHPGRFKFEPNVHIQILSSLFYRGKSAYAIGRLVNGHRRDLFAFALRHSESNGLVVDAFIYEREHLANLMSVAHAYFMVDMEVPSSWVSFINTGLPEKPKAELYTAVGLQKQGKTLFFRDLFSHLKHSADKFVVAPGVRGMVMCVFTLPSFPFVFKVIRDSFEPPKDITREKVMEKYLLVKRHDRVGRLADTLEYSDVAFPIDRFDIELLEEMKKKISGSIEFEGNLIILKHLYIEQRMTPLDIYLRNADSDLGELGDKRIRHGIREFGQTLRDLAAANIFCGDLLPKNFGVSPYGRVLFYDFDEVCYLTECNFRKLPVSQDPQDEMRAESWFGVSNNDIFPEEFIKFLFSNDRAHRIFNELNSDLLTPDFWRDMQDKIRSGTETNLFPYPEEIRFR